MPKVQGTVQITLASKDDYTVVNGPKHTDIVVPIQGTDYIVTLPNGLLMQFAHDVVKEQLRESMPKTGLIRIRRIV